MTTCSPFPDRSDAVLLPVKQRNAVADWIFYDISNLTAPERDMLIRTTTREGAILVVEPRGEGGSIRIQKFNDFMSFRREPGDLLRHFTIAGVGSSDLGAASFARTLAEHLDAPVGAIVAGYGVADLLGEAMGGWIFFGAANRLAVLVNAGQTLLGPGADRQAAATALGSAEERTDTRTMLHLLLEPERQVETLLGHSKECLSIAFALGFLALMPDRSHFGRAKDIEVLTTGAVVSVPPGLNRLRQYLGGLDWFGGMNSSLSEPFVTVPDAWHHVNTKLPACMDVARVLAGDYG